MTLSLTPVELLSAMAEDIVAKNEITEAPLLGMLAANAEMKTQSAIEWAAQVSNATAGGRTTTGALSDDSLADIKQAQMSISDWLIKHQFTINKNDMVIAASTAKIGQLRNPVRKALNDAIISLARKAQANLYTGTGAANSTHNGIFGLDAIAGQTGSYAGLSRTSYAGWKSIVGLGATPGTPEAFSVTRINKILNLRRAAGASSVGGDGSNLIIVCSDTAEREMLRKAYGVQAKEQFQYSGELNRAIAPYVRYSIQSIPVISDIDCADSKMYFLNLNQLAIHQFDDSSAQVGNPRVSYAPLRVGDDLTPMQIRIADVNINHPDTLSFELSFKFQLVAYNPVDSVSVLQDLDVDATPV